MIESKYLNQYLTFEILSPGSITWTCSTTNSAAHARSIAYKVLDSSNAVIHDWVNVPSSRLGATLTSGVSQEYNFLTGQKVLIKISDTVNPQAYGSNGSTPFSNYFGGTSQVKVYGNILSLLIGDRVLELTADNATSTDYNCAFIGLFGGYTNLMDVENLQLGVDTLTPYCYAGMFSGCTNITKSPQLTSANASAEGCYNEMFSYCSSLSLIKCTATNIGSHNNCINWVENVAANGTFVWANGSFPTTETKSYDNRWSVGINGIPEEWTTMTVSQWEDENAVTEEEEASEFWDADELEVINIIANQYDCNVNTLTRETTFASLGNNLDMEELINTVEDEFDFDIPDSVRSFVTVGEFVDYVMEHAFGHEILPVDGEEEEETNYADEYFTIVAQEAGQISYSFIEKNDQHTLSYKKNNGSWITVDSSNWDLNISVQQNDKIYFKGNLDKNVYIKFCEESSTKFNVKGNILSLVYGDNFINKTSLDSTHSWPKISFENSQVINASNLILPLITLIEGCYKWMFMNCTSLTTAPELPATELAESCYEGMFMNCTSLTKASNLPVTELAESCYKYMFSSCENLTIASELPATELAKSCYEGMFAGCTSLINAPILPAIHTKPRCYWGMFSGCTSLITAPKLPATELAEYCYEAMFRDCTSLVTAPVLPAMSLAPYCYSKMFSKCSSLTTAPQLPAKTLTDYCYSKMFASCISLINVPTFAATIMAPHCCERMFGAYEEGNFHGCENLVIAPQLPAQTLADYCYAYMFEGCARLVHAPSILPATTLAKGCYKGMFAASNPQGGLSCDSLTNAPILPALDLVEECYKYMFKGCSNLKFIVALYNATYDPDTYTDDWVDGVAETGVFYKNPDTFEVTGPDFIPSNWVIRNEYKSNHYDNDVTQYSWGNTIEYLNAGESLYMYIDNFEDIDLIGYGYNSYEEFLTVYLRNVNKNSSSGIECPVYKYTGHTIDLSSIGNNNIIAWTNITTPLYLWEGIGNNNDCHEQHLSIGYEDRAEIEGSYLISNTINYEYLNARSIETNHDNKYVPYFTLLNQDQSVYDYINYNNYHKYLVKIKKYDSSSTYESNCYWSSGNHSEDANTLNPGEDLYMWIDDFGNLRNINNTIQSYGYNNWEEFITAYLHNVNINNYNYIGPIYKYTGNYITFWNEEPDDQNWNKNINLPLDYIDGQLYLWEAVVTGADERPPENDYLISNNVDYKFLKYNSLEYNHCNAYIPYFAILKHDQSIYDYLHNHEFIDHQWLIKVAKLTGEMVPKYHLYTDKDSTYEFAEDEMNAGNADTYYDNKRKNIIVTPYITEIEPIVEDDIIVEDLCRYITKFIDGSNGYSEISKFSTFPITYNTDISTVNIYSNEFTIEVDSSKICRLAFWATEPSTSASAQNVISLCYYETSHANGGRSVDYPTTTYNLEFAYASNITLTRIINGTEYTFKQCYTDPFTVSTSGYYRFNICASCGIILLPNQSNISSCIYISNANSNYYNSYNKYYLHECVIERNTVDEEAFKKAFDISKKYDFYLDEIESNENSRKTNFYKIFNYNLLKHTSDLNKISIILDRFDSFFTEDSFNNPTVENNVFKFLREKWMNKEPYYIDKANDSWEKGPDCIIKPGIFDPDIDDEENPRPVWED